LFHFITQKKNNVNRYLLFYTQKATRGVPRTRDPTAPRPLRGGGGVSPRRSASRRRRKPTHDRTIPARREADVRRRLARGARLARRREAASREGAGQGTRARQWIATQTSRRQHAIKKARRYLRQRQRVSAHERGGRAERSARAEEPGGCARVSRQRKRRRAALRESRGGARVAGASRRGVTEGVRHRGGRATTAKRPLPGRTLACKGTPGIRSRLGAAVEPAHARSGPSLEVTRPELAPDARARGRRVASGARQDPRPTKWEWKACDTSLVLQDGFDLFFSRNLFSYS